MVQLIDEAKARYASALLPVCLEVSPDVLRSRLEQRGRETQKEIAQRLDRAVRYTPTGCLMLNNDGSLLQSVDTFLQMIRTHGNQKESQHVL